MMRILEVHELSKQFGKKLALDRLSFHLDKGEVLGIIGPNGAGKTTFFNMLLSLIRPSSGRYLLFGEPTFEKVKQKVGVSLEDYGFYPYLSGWDNLKITANSKGVPRRQMEEALHLVELYEAKDLPVSKYSFGMSKRLSIACALLGRPELIILDEPTNGLDPLGIRKIRNLVHRLAAQGIAVIIANHLLGEVEKVCDRILLLQEGKTIDLIATSSIGLQKCFQWELSDAHTLYKELVLIPGIQVMDVDLHCLVFTAQDPEQVPLLHSRFLTSGYAFGECIERKLSLEDIFYASLLKKNGPANDFQSKPLPHEIA